MCKILIVDDDHTKRLLLKEILKYSNHKLFEASNGKDAVEIARVQKPECILMDIQMPIEATSEIRKIYKTKIYSLTTHVTFC